MQKNLTASGTSSAKTPAAESGNAGDRLSPCGESRRTDHAYSQLFYGAADGVLIWDEAGAIRDANDAACLLAGYEREKLLGRNCFDLFPAALHSTLEELPDRASHESDGTILLEIESTLLKRDGQGLPVMLRAAAVRHEKKVAILGVVHDLREIKNLEARLLSYQARYEEIVESVEEVILAFGEDGRLRFINAAGERSLGRDRKELTGIDIREILHPEDIDRLDAILNAGAIDSAGGPPILRLVSASRKVREFAVVSASRPADAEGVIHCVLHDVTRQKEVDGRLQYAERMRSIGEILSKITHEVRNPLAAIHASAEFLRRHWDADEESKREVVGLIADEVNRLNGIITEFLRIRQIPRPSMVEQAIGPVVAQVMKSLEMYLKNKRGVAVSSLVKPAVFEFDADLIKQVMWNLINNSIDAVGEKGDIEIVGEPLPGDGFYELRVVDNGCGMMPADARRAFEPFVTSKKTGTGLGLALVKIHVEAMGGRVGLESRPGRGTAVRVQLPLVSKDEG